MAYGRLARDTQNLVFIPYAGKQNKIAFVLFPWFIVILDRKSVV